VGQAEGNLDVSSQLADRIAEDAPLPTTASIAEEPGNASLLQKIEDLSRQVEALSSYHIRQRSRSREKCSDIGVRSTAHSPKFRDYCR